ncbi:MAG: pantoate--beta-alanine ligase [Bacteroidales bacterium]|jgi:pantoate--beta-alanine ligase|nr:pantoate--beta-alanine ligase [Bacteroidales bacterium]
MKLVKTVKELNESMQLLRTRGTVGFVPTMGALHKGHISLVENATCGNNVVVVSIFVNPTQFNNIDDLERYPRNLDADLNMLADSGCDLVFAPSVAEMYPVPDNRKFRFGTIETVMEGKYRPGHFNGVAQIVSKLFDTIKPDKAYFGLKDFQQLTIIKSMVKQLNLPVEIVPCSIIREKNGLAMSSRNRLLNNEETENAAIISNTLFMAKELVGKKSVKELVEWVTEKINSNPFLNVEYFEIVDDTNLQHIEHWEEDNTKVGCIAVYCGKVRLIDNIVLN